MHLSPTWLALVWMPAGLLACGGSDDDDHDGADVDRDGFPADEDCDDHDAEVNPEAEERCNGKDDDCDNAVDEGDAVDTSVVYADSDGDGYGDDDSDNQGCPSDGWVVEDGDCDDDDDEIHPGAAETCNQRDDNCDGETDEGVAWLWYPDSDGDGFGDTDHEGEPACEDPPSGPRDWVQDNTDCDDDDDDIHPDGQEVCDSQNVDEDCDGAVDDDDDSVDMSNGRTWYPDADNDGFGDEADAGVLSCDDPTEGLDWYTLDQTDCDDENGDVNPDAREVCRDELDNNCDGVQDDTCSQMDAANWMLEGSSNDRLGQRVDIGDLNGDDKDDLVVTVYGYDPSSGTGAEGGTFVFHGPLSTNSATLAVTDADWGVYGEGAVDLLGSDAVVTDDLDQDGTNELLVQSANFPEEAENGAVYLFQGPSGGVVDISTAQLRITGLEGGVELGLNLPRSLGDLDGDGRSDLVLGSNPIARTYVFLGVTTGELSASDADVTLTGSKSSDDFGNQVASGADLNGDGSDDLAIGAYDKDTLYIFYGPVTQDAEADDADVTMTGLSGDSFSSIVRHGDTDDDGSVDLIVGEPYYDASTSSTGAVYVFLGPASSRGTATADAVITGNGYQDFVGTDGTEVEVADCDADGVDDLTIGDAKNDDSYNNAGAVSVFLSPISGTWAMSAADHVFVGEAVSNGIAGTGVAIGDLDHDGVMDLAVGAPGHEDSAPSGRAYVLLDPGF